MKQLILLYGDNCGYCKKAKMLLERALSTHSEYLSVDIRYLSELDKDAMALKHQLIPAFFCGGKLFFEGNPDMNMVTSVLRRCMEDDN